MRVVLGISARVEPRRRRTSKTNRIHNRGAAVRLRLLKKVAHFDPHDCEPPLRNTPKNAMEMVVETYISNAYRAAFVRGRLFFIVFDR